MKHHFIYFLFHLIINHLFPLAEKNQKNFLNSGSHFFVPRHLRKTTLIASLGVAFRQISLTKKFPKSKIYVSLFYFFLPPIFGHDKKACEYVKKILLQLFYFFCQFFSPIFIFSKTFLKHF